MVIKMDLFNRVRYNTELLVRRFKQVQSSNHISFYLSYESDLWIFIMKRSSFASLRSS